MPDQQQQVNVDLDRLVQRYGSMIAGAHLQVEVLTVQAEQLQAEVDRLLGLLAEREGQDDG